MSYTQVKVSVDPQVAESFKQACKASGISMAKVLTDFMAKYGGGDAAKPTADLSTKRQRRAAVAKVIQRLERIKTAQECCQSRMPESLQNSDAFESANQWISALDDAIEILASLD